jgi:hypothetical protein
MAAALAAGGGAGAGARRRPSGRQAARAACIWEAARRLGSGSGGSVWPARKFSLFLVHVDNFQ